MSTASTTAPATSVVQSSSRLTLFHGVAALVAVCGLVKALSITDGAAVRNDFVHYYLGAKFVLSGENPYAVPLQPHIEQLSGQYDPRIPVAAHPPLLLRFFCLFAWMPIEFACYTWLALQVLLLVLFVELVRRTLNVRCDALWWWIAISIFLNSTALHMQFFYSQVQVLVGCLIVGAYLVHRGGRPATGCALATIAAAFKLYPLILLPWFAFAGCRNSRDMATRATAAAIVGLIVLLITGIQPWLDFRELGLPVIRLHADTNPFNFSIYGLLASLTRTISGTPLSQTVADYLLHVAKWIGCGLLAMTYATIVWRRRTIADHVPLSLLLIVMITIGLVSWSHYLVLLSLPCAVLIQHAHRFRMNWQRIFAYGIAALALLPALECFVWTDLDSVPRMVVHYYPLIIEAALATMLLAVPETCRHRRRGKERETGFEPATSSLGS
ncbi:MAG: DUF2029 domain-containing protein [Planctomycetales bacterium]|nr:DUF2029 domain-containing protein [Planctomycetales bacterium]